MVWRSGFLRDIGSGGWRLFCGLVLAGLLSAAAAADEPGATQEPAAAYFQIGTGSAGGTYFPIGGLIANAITYRPGGKDCGAGGCGVSGLIAVAQATQGSVENAMQIEAGQLESGLVQADVAYWLYFGQRIYAGRKPAAKLRAIANLYVEDIQLVARRDAGIRSVADLKGKRVSLGDRGSGTDVDARIVLGGFGLTEKDVRAQHLGPVPSADLMREGKLDAFFLVSGAPSPAVTELAADTAAGPRAVTLVPIEGKGAARIRSAYPFYSEAVVAGGTYRGVAPTVTLGVKAQWLVSADADEGLVYEITRALWHRAARPLLDAGHPEARNIRLETALQGVELPLHPGAARYYREIGLLKN
jgi:TRAP transporter TAXI family solute receptor